PFISALLEKLRSRHEKKISRRAAQPPDRLVARDLAAGSLFATNYAGREISCLRLAAISKSDAACALTMINLQNARGTSVCLSS
ncbi:MAG: hypothetical protein ACXWGY_06260, partial [Chthoniobacterales bacterium]